MKSQQSSLKNFRIMACFVGACLVMPAAVLPAADGVFPICP